MTHRLKTCLPVLVIVAAVSLVFCLRLASGSAKDDKPTSPVPIKPPEPAPKPPTAPAPSPVPPIAPMPDPKPPTAPVAPPAIPQPPDITDLPSIGNKVDGLALPDNFTVPSEKGLITIRASTEGRVQWFAFGTAPVEAQVAGNSIVLSVPRERAILTVLATALIVRKDPAGQVIEAAQTQFAACLITVEGPKGGTGSGGSGGSAGNPPRATGQIYVTIVEDPAARTPALAAIINSAKVKEAVGNPTHFKAVDNRDPWLKMVGIGDALASAKQLPAIVIQERKQPTDKIAPVIWAQPLPATEEQTVELIRKIRGQ
jgi:hypothetical protein